MIHVVAESAVGRVARLRLAGDLTCHSIPVLAEVCAGYARQGIGQVQMDLADLWSVDVLSCWALARLPRTSIHVQFAHAGPPVRTLLESFGMG
ncbi:MAG: STAS domain-containing protein [Candidatus Latescibacterota bacterium]